MSKTILERKQALIDKLERVRKSYHHKFDVETGKCKYCSTTILDLPVETPLRNLDLMCSVITPEEVSNFRDPREQDGGVPV